MIEFTVKDMTCNHCAATIARAVARSRFPSLFTSTNAARLFQHYLFSVEAQQIFIDVFAHRSFHAQTKELAGRPPLSSFKLLQADPKLVLAQSEEIKTRYSKLFGV